MAHRSPSAHQAPASAAPTDLGKSLRQRHVTMISLGSYVVVASIAGVLIAMGFDHSLASQLLTSLGSLVVVSLAYLLTRKQREHGAAVHAKERRDLQRSAQASPDQARSARHGASGRSLHATAAPAATHWKK